MKALILTAAAVLSLGFSVYSANLVVNSGFEDPITYDGPPFVGAWEGFNGGNATAANSTLFPRTGAQSLQLAINNAANTFAGAFQDIPGLLAGSEYIFGGWHATASHPFDVGVEIRIEWRNSLSNTEISRTPNLTPVPTGAYSLFNLTAAVPAGADTARLVYAIQSVGSGPTHNGIAYVDDISFAVVPEPSTCLLVLAGAFALNLNMHRRMGQTITTSLPMARSLSMRLWARRTSSKSKV